MEGKKREPLTKDLEREKKNQYRLNLIRTLFEAGKINSFDDIFMMVPSSHFARILRMGFDTFKNKVNNPTLFTIGEISNLADLIGVDRATMFHFIINLRAPGSKI